MPFPGFKKCHFLSSCHGAKDGTGKGQMWQLVRRRKTFLKNLIKEFPVITVLWGFFCLYKYNHY